MESVHPNYIIVPSNRDGWDSLKGIDAYTKLMLHCNGTDGSTTFTDTVGTHTVTAAGNAQLDTAQKKFGTASALFDGVGDYLTIPDHDDFDFNSGDFTIDFLYRHQASGEWNDVFFRQIQDASNTYTMRYYSGTDNKLEFLVEVANVEIITLRADPYNGLDAPNTWYHIALVRYGNIFTIYVDGVSVATTTVADDMPNLVSIFYIGIGINGWLEEFRISKGIARWTKNFIPPYGPYRS